MITEQTDHGEVIIRDNRATRRFQSFLDALTEQANLNGYIFTVSTVPDATENEGRMIYVQDETGGATMAFSDGSDWRRVQDRAVIS